MESWTEKYRPKSLKDIVGNKEAIDALYQWALLWKRKNPNEIKHKAVVLEGKPGVGKTSAALALANDMGWEVIELNASDVRSEEQIKKIVTSKINLQTIGHDGKLKKMRLILLDEADNLYEAQMKGGDRGGKKAIVQAIEITMHPIILIVNDSYELFEGYYGMKLKELCEHIKFKRLHKNEVLSALKKICEKEGLNVESNVLNIIAARASGDLRAAINDLQSIAEKHKKITQKDTDVLGYRDEWNSIYESVLGILRTESLKFSADLLRRTDEDLDYILLWIDENMPLEYTDEEDMVRAYEFLSKADIYLGRIMKRQYFGLMKYASDMIAAVSIAKKKKYTKHPEKYSFPSWLKLAKISKARRDLRYSVSLKLGRYTHSSVRSVVDNFDYYSEIVRNSEKIGALLHKRIGLDEEELNILVRDNKVVEKIMKL